MLQNRSRKRLQTKLYIDKRIWTTDLSQNKMTSKRKERERETLLTQMRVVRKSFVANKIKQGAFRSRSKNIDGF